MGDDDAPAPPPVVRRFRFRVVLPNGREVVSSIAEVRDRRAELVGAAGGPAGFEVRYVDEIGVPIAGLETTLRIAGKNASATTDDDGVARLDAKSGRPRAEVADADALRTLVKDRWDQIRSGDRLTRDDGAIVLLLHDAPEEVQLDVQQRKLVSIQPKVELARLVGMLFDTDKNFLLPSAIPTIQQLRKFYDDNPAGALLVVGHTDTSGDRSYNDKLSLERAESVAAYLKNQVAVWLARYGTSVAAEKRWGAPEDLLMLSSVLTQPAFDGSSSADDPVRFFQARHNQLVAQGKSGGGPDETADETDAETLKEDGKPGPRTRRALICAYMRHDRTTVPPEVSITIHGCGENFPLDASEQNLDRAAADGEHVPRDRRTELFFFDGKLGVQPPPPGTNSGKGSSQYPEWRRRAQVVKDLGPDAPDSVVDDLLIRMLRDGTRPLDGRRFRLEVDDVVLVKDALTGKDGLIQARPRPGSKRGSITFIGSAPDGTDADLWTVQMVFGKVPPAADVKGTQIRLANAGLFPGREDGQKDERTDRAILRFQTLLGISPQRDTKTGELLLDPATAKRLDDYYRGS